MVNTYELRLTLLQQDILRHLFKKAGTVMTARALSLALGVSQPAVSKALPNLRKTGLILITKDKETRRLSIQIDRDNPLVIGLKRADNLKQVYESGLAQFLYDNLKGATVILFGSYASGEDTLTSDADIAVVGMRDRELDLREFEKKLGREIILNFYSSFKEMDKPLLDNVLGGMLLKGGIEL